MNLASRNLSIHAEDTKYVHSTDGRQTLVAGGKEIEGVAGGSLAVLGAPAALKDEVVIVLGGEGELRLQADVHGT